MHFSNRFALVIACASLFSAPAFALSSPKSPNVVKGEFELEYFGGTTFDNDKSKDNIQEHEFEMEYGLTDRFGIELSGELEHEPGEKLRSSAFELAGRYQFFEQGENWVDSGMKLAYIHGAHEDDADAIEAKLLLEKQTGKILHRANLKAEKEIGDHAVDGMKTGLVWSSRYRYRDYFEPGFEIQSDFGKANDGLSFNEQEHYVGPAAYGKITPHLNYEAAYFMGVSDAASDGAARVKLEYEWYF